jgi:hypothetical protein
MDKIYLKDNYIVTELSGVTAVFGKNYTVYSENTTTFFLNSSFPINNARSVTIDFSRSSTIFNEAGTVAYTTATLRSFFLANTGFKSPVGGSTGITVGTTPITSGVDGRVLFQSGGVVSQDSGFTWDNTNKRLELGLLGSNGEIVVKRATTGTTIGGIRANLSGAGLEVGGSGYYDRALFGNGQGIQFFTYTTGTSSAERMRITSGTSGGQLVIGATTAGARLDVRAQGALSTDIAFRVRNSADTLDLLSVNGLGVLTAAADAVVNGVNVGRGGGNLSTNTRVGLSALNANTTGGESVAVGWNSLVSSQNGSRNVGIGFVSIGLINGSSDNIAIGHRAGRYFGGGISNNLTLTQSSIFMGSNASPLANNQTNQIVIGHNATGLGSNTVVLGNDSIVTTQLRGTVRLSLQASAPAGVEGAIYYDSTTKKHYGHDGTTWNALY